MKLFFFNLFCVLLPYSSGMFTGIWVGRRMERRASDAVWKRKLGEALASAFNRTFTAVDKPEAAHTGPCTCLGCVAELPPPSMVGGRMQTPDEYVESLSPEQFEKLAALEDLPKRHVELRRAVAARASKPKMLN